MSQEDTDHADRQESVDQFVDRIMNEYEAKNEELLQGFQEYVHSFDTAEELMKEQFPQMAWREMAYGTLPPARQVSLIHEKKRPYSRDLDLIIALSKQINDEHGHAKIYSHLYEEVFGEKLDLLEYTPTPFEGEYSVQYFLDWWLNWEEPHYSAMAFQCTMEMTAAIMGRHMANFIEDDYPSAAKTIKQNVVADEGDHTHAGRLVVQRYATPDELDRLEQIAEDGFRKRRESLEEMFA